MQVKCTMKKKISIYFGAILIFVGSLFEYNLSSNGEKLAGTLLKNVKTLTQLEDYYIRCYNYRDIDCLGEKLSSNTILLVWVGKKTNNSKRVKEKELQTNLRLTIRIKQQLLTLTPHSSINKERRQSAYKSTH